MFNISFKNFLIFLIIFCGISYCFLFSYHLKQEAKDTTSVVTEKNDSETKENTSIEDVVDKDKLKREMAFDPDFNGLIDIKGEIKETPRGYTLYSWLLTGDYDFKSFIGKEVIVRVEKTNKRTFKVHGIVDYKEYTPERHFTKLPVKTLQKFSLDSDPINQPQVQDNTNTSGTIYYKDSNGNITNEPSNASKIIIEGTLLKNSYGYNLLGWFLNGSVNFQECINKKVSVEGTKGDGEYSLNVESIKVLP